MLRKRLGVLVWRSWNIRATTLSWAIMLGAACVSAGGNRRSNEWRHYGNARWGFCLDYPADWNADEAKDGFGASLHPPASEHPGAAYISISAIPDEPQDLDNENVVLDDTPAPNLEQNFANELERLREYGHVSDIRVLEKRKLQFQGYEALRTKFYYRAEPNASRRSDETLWINKRYLIFAASLIGKPDEVRVLEPTYRQIVKHRLRLACGAGR